MAFGNHELSCFRLTIQSILLFYEGLLYSKYNNTSIYREFEYQQVKCSEREYPLWVHENYPRNHNVKTHSFWEKGKIKKYDVTSGATKMSLIEKLVKLQNGLETKVLLLFLIKDFKRKTCLI